MCRAFEETRREGALQHAVDMAKRMIEKGKLTLEDISDYSGLSLEEVRKLAAVEMTYGRTQHEAAV